MNDLSQRTLVFLVTDEKVLLGFKKTGFGNGRYLGIGRKIEAGETEMAAAAREVEEEIGVTELKLQKVAELTFRFPDQPSWSQVAHVYIANKWRGEPVETAEIRPEWFDKKCLPLTQMWEDAQFWLPALLNGYTFSAEFTFDPELKVKQLSFEQRNFAN